MNGQKECRDGENVRFIITEGCKNRNKVLISVSAINHDLVFCSWVIY